MEFCPKCGSILMMKKSKFGCSRCSYMSKTNIKLEIKEKVNQAVGVAVVNEKQGEMYPITEYKCGHCGNKEAYFWIRQMRSGDEPESKFFKCTKCKVTVRVDD